MDSRLHNVKIDHPAHTRLAPPRHRPKVADLQTRRINDPAEMGRNLLPRPRLHRAQCQRHRRSCAMRRPICPSTVVQRHRAKTQPRLPEDHAQRRHRQRHLDSLNHRIVPPGGAVPTDGSFAGSRYGHCYPNNPDYRAFAGAQAAEILDGYAFDGMFFDMTFFESHRITIVGQACILCTHTQRRSST